jgi:hypothetical protein
MSEDLTYQVVTPRVRDPRSPEQMRQANRTAALALQRQVAAERAARRSGQPRAAIEAHRSPVARPVQRSTGTRRPFVPWEPTAKRPCVHGKTSLYACKWCPRLIAEHQAAKVAAYQKGQRR